MDISRLKELIALLESSTLAELEIEEAGQKVRLAKHVNVAPAMSWTMPPGGMVPHAHTAAPAAPAEEEAPNAGLTPIEAPMVGTFYSAPAPGEAPYVLPGGQVTAGQVICIVEAMKIMNEVTAKVSGILEQVLVENGEPVEYGQPLFLVRPSA